MKQGASIARTSLRKGTMRRAVLGQPSLQAATYGLLTGDLEPAVTAPAAAEAQQLRPELQAVQMHQAGHNVRRDQYEAYWQSLTRFLTGV